MNGKWIWPFELQEKLGEGGMGVVYKARYVKDDRLFAVKLIPADVNNKTLIARFEREIEVLKTLRHPHIVRAFGGVCEDKQRFYAMELVDGGTLWDKIQSQGYLSWDKVTDWGQQMCAALAYAHEKQIIHRDVKPNNFLLTKSGVIKLSDFGLVSVMSEAKLTADGRTLGTVQYMSPEQIRGKPPLTPASDLYSLGCVFYEMLTGHPPFSGESPGPILHAHLTEVPPPISQFNSDCPAALERLVMSMLEKLPESRPATADEVSEKLAQIRLSPRLVEPSTASGKIGLDLSETPGALQPVLHVIKESLRYSGVALSALLVLLVLIWGYSLLRADQGTDLWLETMLTHSQLEVRIAAVEAVAQLAERNKKLLGELMHLAEDTTAEVKVRREAIRQLGLQRSRASSFKSRLNKLAKTDPTESIRTEALTALNEMGNPPE